MPKFRRVAPRLAALSMVLAGATWSVRVGAQSLEPRAYSPAPIGMNFLVIGLTDTRGGLSFDPALPVTDAKLHIPAVLVGYARSVDFWGKSGKFDIIIPYAKLSGSALFNGERLERHVKGFGDPLVRASVILHGAPALSGAAFRSYRQDLIVGASVQISLPLGQYDKTRLVNLGANRWFVKPEIGISKASGRFTLETSASATFYGKNKDFFGGKTRSQAPIFSTQAHLVYTLRSGAWVAVNATYFTGGKTEVNGVSNRNLQRNWRLGITTALPINRRFSLKFNASEGVSARTGNNFELLAVAVQYRWGAGI